MTFLIAQGSLAERLGIPVHRLKELRDAHLTEGTDFVRRGRQGIFYSPESVEKLAGLLGAPTTAWVPPAPEEGDLIVRRAREQGITNRYVVEAYRPGHDPGNTAGLIRVRVTDNTHFVPGMVIPARQLEGDYWECTRRAPRKRGRW